MNLKNSARKCRQVVWVFDTFENNFEIENESTKYVKESCR